MTNRAVTRRSTSPRSASDSRFASAGRENGRRLPRDAENATPKPGQNGAAVRPLVSTHAALWAQMDELARQVTALWPRGVSAAEAVSAARRAR